MISFIARGRKALGAFKTGAVFVLGFFLAGCMDTWPGNAAAALTPAAFDNEGCLLYSVRSEQMSLTVLQYKTASGQVTLDRNAAVCRPGQVVQVDRQRGAGGCESFRLRVDGLTSDQRFYNARGGGYTADRQEAAC